MAERGFINYDAVASYPGPRMQQRAEATFANAIVEDFPENLGLITVLAASNLEQSRITVNVEEGPDLKRINNVKDGLSWLAFGPNVPGNLLDSVRILGSRFTTHFDQADAINSFATEVNGLANWQYDAGGLPAASYIHSYGKTWHDKGARRDVYMCLIDTVMPDFVERQTDGRRWRQHPIVVGTDAVAEQVPDLVVSRAAWMIPAGTADVVATIALRTILEVPHNHPTSRISRFGHDEWVESSDLANVSYSFDQATQAALTILESISTFGPVKMYDGTVEEGIALNERSHWKF